MTIRTFTIGTAKTRKVRRPLLVRLHEAFFAMVERAEQRRSLSGLSDQVIHDMGLSRADVEYESSKPFWRV